MIVQVVNNIHVAALKSECNTPIPRHLHSVDLQLLRSQQVQIQSWQSDIVNTRHGIENIQNQSQTFVVFGLYALQGAALEERLEPLVPETLDHPDSPFIVRTTKQA